MPNVWRNQLRQASAKLRGLGNQLGVLIECIRWREGLSTGPVVDGFVYPTKASEAQRKGGLTFNIYEIGSV